MKRSFARALRAIARRLDGQPCALEQGERAYEKFNGMQRRF